MAHHHAPGAARETAIGDESHAFAQTSADQRARRGQHFRHTGAALGPQITQHHHIPCDDFAGQDGFQGRLLIVEHTGRAGDDGVLQSRDLGHGAFRAQVALQDGQVALCVHRLVDAADHVLVRAGLIGHVLQYFGNGLAADGDAVAMQQARVEQHFHHLRNPACAVQIYSQVLAAGLEVAQHGRFDAHAFEIVDGPLHLCRVGNCQEVQDRVGRAASGHDDRHRVFDGLPGHDIAGFQVHLDGLDQHFRRLFGRVHLLVMRVGHGGRVGEADAQCLEGAGHGVGGVHATARARAGDGALFDFLEVEVTHLAGGVLAHGFKHAHDVQVLTLVVAGQDGAAIDVNGRHVRTQHAHQATWHVLVAAAHDQHAIHPLAAHTGLNAVTNDLAADQAVFHAFGAHGHAVRNGGRAEHLRIATRLFNAFDGRVGQLLQSAVARGDGAVAIGHAHHGLDEISLLIAHGVVHRAVGRTGLALRDVGAAAVDGLDRDDFAVGHGGGSWWVVVGGLHVAEQGPRRSTGEYAAFGAAFPIPFGHPINMYNISLERCHERSSHRCARLAPVHGRG